MGRMSWEDRTIGPAYQTMRTRTLLNRLHVRKNIFLALFILLKLAWKFSMLPSYGMQCRTLKCISLIGCYIKEIQGDTKEIPAK